MLTIITVDLDAKTNNSISKLVYGTKATITCWANSSQSCSYTWKWVDEIEEEVVSNRSTFETSRTGLYKCEAECSIRGKLCTVLYRLVHVSEQTGKNVSSAIDSFRFCFIWLNGLTVNLRKYLSTIMASESK